MKKICILASVALLATTQVNAQARMGLIGGVNINNQLDHYQGETVSNQLKTGLHFGGLAEFCLAPNWTLQPGLIYIMKGGLQQRTLDYTTIEGSIENKIKDKLTLNYIEMPVNFIYRASAGSGHVFVGLGGYAAACFGATTSYKYKYNVNGTDMDNRTVEGKAELNIGDDANDDIHRFDFGLTGILGYEFSNGWFLRGGVDAGLFDIVRTSNPAGFAASQPATFTSDPTSKNISYLFSIGYMFRH